MAKKKLEDLSLEELQAKAEKLGIEVTEEDTEETLIEKIQASEAEKKSSKSEPVHVRFYHKGHGKHVVRKFEDADTAEEFSKNPANHWKEGGEVQKPEAVEDFDESELI